MDWYRQDSVAALVLEYYFVLRSVLRAKPKLRACRTRCRQCGIFFLTHPRNVAQRQKVRCPFGCREAHRKRQSVRRSVVYYRDPQSQKAQKGRPQSTAPSWANGVPAGTAQVRSAPKAPLIVEHVRMVVSLIEGRRISRWQVLRMMAKVWRQHTMVRPQETRSCCGLAQKTASLS